MTGHGWTCSDIRRMSRRPRHPSLADPVIGPSTLGLFTFGLVMVVIDHVHRYAEGEDEDPSPAPPAPVFFVSHRLPAGHFNAPFYFTTLHRADPVPAVKRGEVKRGKNWPEGKFGRGFAQVLRAAANAVTVANLRTSPTRSGAAPNFTDETVLAVKYR